MRSSEAGITLLEVTLILVVTTVMVAALTPAVAATVASAKITRATTDMTAIAGALNDARIEMNNNPLTTDGSNSSAKRVLLLVSDGDIPEDCTAAPTGCGGGTTASSWQRPVDNATGLTDFLERHLVTNDPGGNPANDYPVNGGNPWRGPYLNAPIDPDPWGNRYMVNSEWFNRNPEDVDVLSAGPDGSIDTEWAGDPLLAGNDDIIVLVEP